MVRQAGKDWCMSRGCAEKIIAAHKAALGEWKELARMVADDADQAERQLREARDEGAWLQEAYENETGASMRAWEITKQAERRTENYKQAMDQRCECRFKNSKIVEECHYHKCQRSVRLPNGDPSDATWQRRAEEAVGFAQHRPRCAKMNTEDICPCSCGLDKVLTAAKEQS